MKQTACQKALPTFSKDYRREEFDLQCVVNSSKAWQCEKCDFRATDFAQFKKHKLQHDVQLMRFYCFYCNHVFWSKEELSRHIEKHNRLFPFKCHYCDYAAEKEAYVVRHMKQKHNAPSDRRPSQQVSGKLTTALPRESRTGIHMPPVSPNPNITPNPSITPNPRITPLRTRNIMTRVGEEGLRVGTVANAEMLPKGQMELLAPLNEPLQYNRPLTVSFPDEVSIPPGCLVELVEVKTVNGAKELKLRLLPPELDGSPGKDCRGTTSQNATSGKASSRSVSDITPHRLKLVNDGSCTANRSTLESMNLNQKCPSTAPSTNSVQLRETFNESKLVRVKDEPKEVNVKTKGSASQPLDVTRMEVKEEHRGLEQKPQCLTSVSPVSSVSVTVNVQGTPSSSVVCKEESSWVLPSTANQPKKVEKSIHLSDPKTSVWIQAEGWNERSIECEGPESKSFPVISSVFSLSQPPDGGCPPTLMVALRRIAVDGGMSSIRKSVVLDKMTAVLTGHDEKVKAGETENVATNNMSTIHEPQMTPQPCNQVETEHTVKCTQHTQTLTENLLNIKNEKPGFTIKVKKAALKLKKSKMKTERFVPTSAQQEATPKNTPHTNSLVAECITGSVPSCAANKQDVSTRLSFSLKPSLKRLRLEDNSGTQTHRQECNTPTLNIQKKRKKQHKVTVTKTLTHISCGVTAVLCPIPLKEDQLVKQPSPNQPVVVLNHPKPQAPRGQAGVETVTNRLASQEVVPKCHIMKMRLSKVMGQKYEVIGCTVRATP